MKAAAPTPAQFAAYQGAFDYFNAALFAGELGPVMLNFSRKAKSRGFYCAAVWERGKQQAAEISVNPDELQRPPRDLLSTLVHEMVHHWQWTRGSPPRRGYHDRQWAAKMIEVGLHPSDTGAEGGQTTGQHMTHYVVEGGAFAAAFGRMPKSLLLPWSARSLERSGRSTRANKTCYQCPMCEAKVWGKPGLNVRCDDCDELFEEAAG